MRLRGSEGESRLGIRMSLPLDTVAVLAASYNCHFQENRTETYLFGFETKNVKVHYLAGLRPGSLKRYLVEAPQHEFGYR